SDVPQLFQRGILPLDAALINVTPPDAHGFCSLGTSVDVVLAAVRASKTVIAQLNRSLPRTLGDGFIHSSQIELAVEHDQPPYARAPAPPSEEERRIGALIADLVPDGATLQMGIGELPAAVGLALAGKR